MQRNSSELIRSLQTDTAEVLNGVITPALNILMALIMGLLVGSAADGVRELVEGG